MTITADFTGRQLKVKHIWPEEDGMWRVECTMGKWLILSEWTLDYLSRIQKCDWRQLLGNGVRTLE